MNVIDKSALYEIYELDEETYREVIDAFLADIDKSYSDIKNAVELNDYDALHKHAHKLKGSSRTLGMNGIGKASYELEMMGRKENVTGALSSLESLRKFIDEGAVFLRDVYNTPEKLK